MGTIGKCMVGKLGKRELWGRSIDRKLRNGNYGERYGGEDRERGIRRGI